MPLLLIIPLAFLIILILWMILLPLSLIQRYRTGKSRHRVRPLLLKFNSWTLVISAFVFLFSAWIGHYWFANALMYASIGLIAGLLLGCVGLALTRYEVREQTLYYTPNRFLLLGLLLMIVLRLGLGVWRMLSLAAGADNAADMQYSFLADHANLYLFGGIILGHYVMYMWGIRGKLRKIMRPKKARSI